MLIKVIGWPFLTTKIFFKLIEIFLLHTFGMFQALQREQEKHMQEFVKVSILTNKEFEANVKQAIESSSVLKSLLPDIKVKKLFVTLPFLSLSVRLY